LTKTTFNYKLTTKIKQQTNKNTKILKEELTSKHGLNYEEAPTMINLNVKGKRIEATRIFIE